MDEGKVEVKQNAASTASVEDKKSDGVDDTKAQNEALKATNAAMRAEIDDIKSTLFSSQKQVVVATQPQDTGFKAPTSDDLETMSRADFLKVADKMMEEKIKTKVSGRIDAVDLSVQEDRMARGVAEAAGKYPDFANYQREMRLVLSRVARDGITPSDLYKLATWKASTPVTPVKKKDKGTTTEQPTVTSSAPVTGLSREEVASKVYDKVMEKQGK